MSIVSPIPASPGVPIIRQLAYIDTLGLRLPRHLVGWERDTLLSLCGSLHYGVKSLKFKIGRRWVSYPVQILIHQPSHEAIQFLTGLFEEQTPARITRLDIALDFCSDTIGNARRLQRYFWKHLFKGWHRPVHGIEAIGLSEEVTDYIGYRNWRSKIVGYSDRPSKVSGFPCYHLEWRFQSHKAIIALGISSIDDLLFFNHRAFWARRLRLYEIHYIKFGKRLTHTHFNTPSRHREYCGTKVNLDERRAQFEIVRISYALADRSPGDVSLMEILSGVKEKIGNVLDVLVPLDVRRFLPVCPRRPTRQNSGEGMIIARNLLIPS